MIASLLQLLFVGCVLVALVALTDWRWALLAGGVLGFAVSFQWERRQPKKAG